MNESDMSITELEEIKKLIGYTKDLRGFLLNKKIKFPQNNKHHVYFYLDLVDAFLEEKTGEKIERHYSNALVITKDERHKVSAILSAAGIDLSVPLVGISPSAAYGSAKEWLPERFRETGKTRCRDIVVWLGKGKRKKFPDRWT